MGGISIWQLLSILLIIGVPVTMYFIIAAGPKAEIQRPLTFFHWSFWVLVIVTVLFFVVAGVAPGPDVVGTVVAPLSLALAVAGWSYLIALGVLASRTGRSWILWVGLTFLTSPFGVIVSYAMMSGRAKYPVAKPLIDDGVSVTAPKESVSDTEPASAHEPKEIASDDEAPFVQKVQVACQIAEMSAGYSDDEYERKRFEEYLDKGLNIARGIKDDFYRSAALHLIVSALIKDGRLEQAQGLISEINVDMIEEKANEELRAARG